MTWRFRENLYHMILTDDFNPGFDPQFFLDNHHGFNDSTPIIGFNHHNIGLQPIIHVTLQPRNGDGIKSKSMTYGVMNFTVPCILRFIHRATKM